MAAADNELRAERARRAAKAWALGQDLVEEEVQEVVTDIMTDLLHLAYRNGIDHATVLRISENHFTEEINKER